MHNIPLFLPEECFLSWSTDVSGKRMMLRTEQMTVKLILDPVCKFSKAEWTVLDTSTGASETGNPW